MANTTTDVNFIIQHGIHALIESSLSAILEKRPSNPLHILAEKFLEAAYPPNSDEGRALRRIQAAKVLFPGNLAMKHFDFLYYGSLVPAYQQRFLQIVKSGLENTDSQMGCYAMHPEDYDVFRPFFSKVLAEYHGVDENAVHINDWDIKTIADLPASGKLDLADLGLPALSMRVRVGRNLEDFALPGSMSKEDRIKMEEKMTDAFAKLIENPKYGGRYHSLTPSHKDHITEEEYQKLVDEHLMFKDMSKDSYLNTAGISSSWPFGRGCYVSADRHVIVWVGEEDHLRIMCMQKGTVLNDVFDRLKEALDTIESIPGLKFAKSPQTGYVTSCPTNIGTGMRASVHIALPHLTKDGTDKKAKAVARPLGLSVRGLGGEHTPIGADGTVDISPSARFCITEAEIIARLYRGLKLLKEQDDLAAKE